jgi:catechol 2,3-dioxygenase-like lactoylglutathione lyase family enzyme
MLGDSSFYATIPTTDLDRAREFYGGVLGLEAIRDLGEEVVYRAGKSEFDVYPTPSAGTAQHTLGTFIVEDCRAAVDELRTHGVTFEEYDFPGLKTEDGVAQVGPDKVAWFKDPDGNILALTQENA